MTAADLVALAGAAAVLLVGRRLRWLTRGGLAAAVAVGAGVWAGAGPGGVWLLLFFFVSASGLGALPARRPPADGGGGGRSAGQVAANGGVAALAGVAGGMGLLPPPAATAAVVGSLAAATADTWASEVGARSRATTLLLTDGRRVEPGTTGGVSLPGTGAAVAGALAAGAVAGLLGVDPPASGWPVVALWSGVAGVMTDSALGATAEARWGVLTNDGVNALGTAVAAAVACLLAAG